MSITMFVEIDGEVKTSKISPGLHERMRTIALNLDIPLVQLMKRCWVVFDSIEEYALWQYLKSCSGPECIEAVDFEGELNKGEGNA